MFEQLSWDVKAVFNVNNMRKTHNLGTEKHVEEQQTFTQHCYFTEGELAYKYKVQSHLNLLYWRYKHGGDLNSFNEYIRNTFILRITVYLYKSKVIV